MKKQKLIVLDIDSVLIDSIRYEKVKHKPTTNWIHGKQKWAIYSRPYLQAFLDFCRKNFEYIALWTRADKFWANYLINKILPPKFPLLFVWTHKDTHPEYKNLSKAWKKYAHLGINETNTIIIEDTPENCGMNMENAIIVPAFLVEHDHEDITFPLLCEYLKCLVKEKSVLDIDKTHWKMDVIEKLLKGKVRLGRTRATRKK